MKLIDAKLYLTLDELAAYGYSLQYLWKVTHKYREGHTRSYANIEDPADRRRCLIDYDSIPAEGLEYRNLPPRADLVRQLEQEQLAASITKDTKALDYYLGRPETHAAADDLQTIAAWLMAAAPANRSTARQYGYTSVDDYYSQIIGILTDSGNSQWKVANLDRFKRKLSPFYKYFKAHPTHFNPQHAEYYIKQTTRPHAYEQALESLISKKNGLRNAAKLQPRNDERGQRQAEEQQALLVDLYSRPQKLSLEDCYKVYIQKATERFRLYTQTDGATGWDEKCLITLQTCKKFLLRADIKKLWYETRFGAKQYDNVFKPITTRRTASFANAKWVIDGTPIHMYFQHQGKAYQRINVFVVMDEHSWAVLGYSIGLSENTEGVLYALRDACARTKAMPYELQSDNSSAIKSWHVQNAIELISEYYIPATAGNARAKRIEPFFAFFNNRILKYKPGYLANPFAKSLDRQPNTEALLAQKAAGQFPTYDEALGILDQAFNEWNAHVFKDARPLEKYYTSMKATADRQRQFTERIDVESFWYQPGRMIQVPDTSGRSRKYKSVFEPTSYKYSAMGISVQRKDPDTKETQTYLFDIPEAAAWNQLIDDSFTLRIEPVNWSCAYLYRNGKPLLNEHGQQLVAGRKEEYSSAMVDRTPGEGGRLAAHLQEKKDARQANKTKLDRYLAISKEAGLHEVAIEATTVHGKLAINGAKAELMEGMLNRFKLPGQADAQEEELEAVEVPIEVHTEPSKAEPATPKKTYNRFDI